MPTPALTLLTTVFLYPAFRGEQAEVIEHVAAGGDALVLMPTGAAPRCSALGELGVRADKTRLPATFR